MRVKFGKGDDMFVLFMAFWELAQDVWGVEKNDQYYDEIVKKYAQFVERYGKLSEPINQFCIGLVLALDRYVTNESIRKYGK